MSKSPTLANPTLGKIFKPYRLLVNPTELEMFYQDLLAKALILINPTELKILVPL